jgi:hypothetical protein
MSFVRSARKVVLWRERWVSSAIQSLEPADDDDLIDRLIESNSSFRAMVAESKLSPRRPFPIVPDA